MKESYYRVNGFRILIAKLHHNGVLRMGLKEEKNKYLEMEDHAAHHQTCIYREGASVEVKLLEKCTPVVNVHRSKEKT